MLKGLFFNIPAHGHINPSLPLVSELDRRGHKITYFTTEVYRQRVAETGASVQIYNDVEDDYFDRRGLDGSIPQKAAHALLTTTKAILPEMLEVANQIRPDYILYDCMCPWGYFVAQIMGLPSVSSASLLPLSPRALLNWRTLYLFFPMLVKGFSDGNTANRLSRTLGKQYQVKPLTMMNILNAPGDLVISYSSDIYVPLAQALPNYVKLVGWTMQENASDAPFVHDSQHPLIYISLGTVANENVPFFEMCINALADTPYDVLISTGGRFVPERFGTPPPNITVKSWVPQSQVLRQASLFITHGGLNSIHDGLYCGLPLLVVPQQTEQTFNALRVVDLGAGLMFKNGEVNPHTLRAAVMHLLSDSRYTSAAKHVGDSLRSAGGIARAVDEIEAMLSRTSELKKGSRK